MPSSPTGGGGITPLCSAGGAVPCSSSVPGGSLPCGMVFSTASCVSPLEAAKVVSGTKQKPRKISAAPVVQLTAHARPILVQGYLQYRLLPEIPHPVDRTSVEHPRCQEKRTPTMPVGAYPRPPHGPHADGWRRFSVDGIQLSVEAIAVLIATSSTRYGVLGAKTAAKARENDTSTCFMPSLTRQRLRRQK